MNLPQYHPDSVLLPAIGIGVGYVLGCFNTAYYLVRWKTGKDIREVGSGNAGAKNASRALGTWGFALSFLGDILKGAVAVMAALACGFPPLAQGFVMLAVICGHNWPVQLGFRGGKGLSASYGALLVFDPGVAGLILGVCAVLIAATRRFTLSAMIAYALSPVVAAILARGLPDVLIFIAFAGLVLFSHRRNIREELSGNPSAPKC